MNIDAAAELLDTLSFLLITPEFIRDDTLASIRGTLVTAHKKRRAYRLGYPSQRESPRDRSITRAFKLRGRLNGEGGIGDYIPKPKWMRWKTYEREIARIEAAEEINNGYLWALEQQLQAKCL